MSTAMLLSCASRDLGGAGEDQGTVSQADTVDPNSVVGKDPLISPSNDAYLQPSVAIDANGAAIVSYERENPSMQAVGWATSSTWQTGSPNWIRRGSLSAGWPALTLSDGTPSSDYSSDTTIVATNNKSEFVLSTIIGDVSNGTACKDIAIALTQNAGASFSAWKVISTLGSGDCGIDQPTIAFSASSGKLWAWWRDSNSTYPPGCTADQDCMYKQYMRQFHVSNGAFVMDTTSPIETDGSPHMGPNGEKARLALGMFHGKETIFAAWSSTNDLGAHCIGGGDDSNGGASQPVVGVQWFLGMSTDGALSWQISTLPDSDNAWPLCVGPGRSGPVNSPEAAFGTNRNLPVPVLDPTEDEIFVAIAKSDGKLLPSTQGTRVKLFGSTSSNLSSWTNIPLPPEKGPPLLDNWGPWLSFVKVPGETHGRLGLTWYTTGDDSTGANRRVSVHGSFSTDGGATFASIVGIASGTGVPWLLIDKWGDYAGGAASPVNGVFLPAWTDNRDETQDRVFGVSVTP